MGKQTKSKKLNSLGKGKVTPIQVAFLVDRYLCDNNFSETRSIFRTEASSLIAKSPVHEAPKSLLSLGELLNEYISLKEQKVMMDEERRRLEQEKLRVESLLQGMQEAMNTYNSNANIAAPVNPPIIPPASAAKLAPFAANSAPPSGSFAGCPVYRSPNTMPLTSNAIMQHGNLSSNRPLTRKRTGSDVVPQATTTKRFRSKLPLANLPTNGAGKQSANVTTIQEINPSSVNVSSPENQRPTISSGVVKNLFNQSSQSPPTVSSGHNTPPPAVNSPNDKSVTPMVNSFNAHCSNTNTLHNVNVTPSNCTIITTERVMVSPCKRMAYMERHCISSSSPVKSALKRTNKRDFVKGRLDFDGSDVAASLDKPTVDPNSTSESDDGDFFDMDLPNLDVFGANFSFSELLVDLDLDLEGANIGSPCQQMLGASTDTLSGSSHESRDCNMGTDQVLSEFSSSATEVISGTDMHMQGSDGLTTVKSVTKCIRIVSPVKSHTSPDHDNV